MDINQVLVDDEDYEYIVRCYDLKIDSNGYVQCHSKTKYNNMGLYDRMSLHKLLINPYKTGRKIVVDHRDGNKLNNQKDNLRLTTQHKNMQNRKVHSSYAGAQKTSKYKGVHFNKQNQKWNVFIKHENGEHEFLGYYFNEDAAANVYNHRAKEIFGDFSLLNDVQFMSIDECEKYRSKKNKSSIYRGVSLVDGKWLAQIYHKGKNIRINSFDREIEAAIAYNERAIDLKGDKAKLNIIIRDDNSPSLFIDSKTS